MIDPRRNDRTARRLAKRGRKRSVLASLSSAAATLLGTPGAALADSPIEKANGAYAFSLYSEDKIKPSRISIGDRERYEIETHQVTFEMPVNERADAAVDFIYESMSGATPWYVAPADGGNKAVQVMTGATVTEKRYDATLRGNYYFDNARTGAFFGASGEKDYLAFYAGVNGEHHLNEKNTTLSGGLSFSIDELKPTDADIFSTRPKKKNKESVGLNASVSQIINRSTTMQLGGSYKHSTGFLSDPYKLAYVSQGGPVFLTVRDKRPNERNQGSIYAQLRRHFESRRASVHLDYRFHYDDWELSSHTVELRWFQNFFDDRLQIVPSFRYYSQGQAYFYEPFYSRERSDGLASSDYRLSPYGSLTFGTRLQGRLYDLGGRVDIRGAVNYERHIADDDFALSKVKIRNPGLVDFHFVYVTLDGRF